MKMDNAKTHNDHRGTLVITEFGDMNYILLETKAGKYRGGEFHDEAQHCELLSGEAVMYFRGGTDGDESTKELKIGEIVPIPQGVIHLFHSITDSITVEWHKAGRSTEYYRPWREKCKV